MYVMRATRNGVTTRVLASGWTESEVRWARESWEADGYTITFGYEVWSY